MMIEIAGRCIRNLEAAVGRITCRGLMVPVALLAALLVASALPQAAEAAPARMRGGIVPGRLLVGVRETMRPAEVGTLQMVTGGEVKKRLAGGRVLVVEVDEMQTMAAGTRALAHPDVLFVEPDRMIYPALVPDDPRYPDQWHLPKTRAPEAWDVAQGSANVVIAVVDTGVDLDHPDLAEKIFTNPGEVPGNGVDDDGNGFVDDVHGWDFQNDTNNPNPEPDGVDDDNNGYTDDQVDHGTLVAGLAAAVGNNSFGVAGIDWGAQILPIQVFPDDGGSTVSQVIEGMDYAVMMGADILNLSIGGDYAQSFTPAIKSAWDAGILVVAAAGNGGVELTDSQVTWESPVCNDGPTPGVDNWVLGVGSTDRNDLRASFSNYDGSTAGTFVDCVAPGEGIFGTGYYDPGFAAFSDYYATNSGTSFSAPLVSGLAALIKSVHPDWGPAQLTAAIKDGCDNIDALNPGFAGKLGAGRINCARALGVGLPPRPARDLVAFDTPDDEGGSITLRWQLSLDDAGGSEAVTEYIILRRQGGSGSFTEIARVPAGTTEYVDDTTSDGTDYYYIVRATDGSQTADSEIAGPVQSANDGPPPQVTGLYAEDRAGDNGGAICVGWDAYSPPTDFDHFAVYRSRFRFTSISSRTPMAEIEDPAATQYIDTSTQDGLDYFYAVTAVDRFGNEPETVEPFGPVQSFANGPHTLPAGLHLFGAPLEPADGDPAGFLGVAPAELKMARWLPADQRYQLYSGPGSLSLNLGYGYWLQLDEPLSFTPAGNPAPSGSLSVELSPGWHQLSNPYFATMDLKDATVSYQGATMDLASADAANVLRQVLWTYDADNNSYNLIAPFLGLGDSEIAPWEGFWTRAENHCSLTLPRPGAVVPAGTMRPASAEVDGWTARLCAASASSVDDDNWFGVSQHLADVGPLVSPPPPGNGVDLYFRPDDGQMRTAGAFAPMAPAEVEWRFVVEASGGDVDVWCADPDSIPRGYSVTLSDPAAGADVDLRRGARYTVRFREGESAREMTLRLTRSGGALALTGVMAQATRAGGGELTFTLSAAADCTVSVMNIAGRTVRVLERGRLRPAGTASVVWDGRSDTGVAVPTGVYLVRVEAASDDGSRAQAVRTLSIRR